MNVEEIMLEMRDGIRLQNFIYYPSENTKFATLLARCMYGTNRVEKRAEELVKRGFVVVLQNIRGRHGSEGTISPVDCPEDGYDTMDWIITQPWSNKKIGTFGASALAEVQVSTAYLAHPAHQAMTPKVLPYGMNSRFGGAYMFSQIPQWMYLSQNGNELKDYKAVEWMPHLFKLPVTSILDDIGGDNTAYRTILNDMHSSYFEIPQGHEENIKKLNTPNLMVTGWYDHCATGSVDFYMHTMKYASKEQRENTHLVIGPWDHKCNLDMSEYDFGINSLLDLDSMENDFFEKHIKGIDSGKTFPLVNIFIMGRNEWREENEWPLSRAKDTRFYLHSNGDVNGAWIKGQLTTELPKEEKPDKFKYDPADPVPTLGGANSGPADALPMKRGAIEQQITLYRKDVLTFYSEPLENPMEVTGMLKCVLYASSSAIDTDFTAKLMDIGLNGNARILSDGIVRARYRKGKKNPEIIIPDKVYKYEIDLWFTSNEFKKEHRVGLALSSSNFPRFNRNLNTGGDNENDSDFVVAKQVIYHDSKYPSHLILPIISDRTYPRTENSSSYNSVVGQDSFKRI